MLFKVYMYHKKKVPRINTLNSFVLIYILVIIHKSKIVWKPYSTRICFKLYITLPALKPLRASSQMHNEAWTVFVLKIRKHHLLTMLYYYPHPSAEEAYGLTVTVSLMRLIKSLVSCYLFYILLICFYSECL